MLYYWLRLPQPPRQLLFVSPTLLPYYVGRAPRPYAMSREAISLPIVKEKFYRRFGYIFPHILGQVMDIEIYIDIR